MLVGDTCTLAEYVFCSCRVCYSIRVNVVDNVVLFSSKVSIGPFNMVSFSRLRTLIFSVISGGLPLPQGAWL